MCEPDFERVTVDVIRQQSDASSEPGEQSLSPYGLWRRSQESWHHGAGQTFLDGKDEKAADPHRFRSSKGIDPWTRGQVSLLPPTMKSWSSTNTNLFLALAQQAGSGLSIVHVADDSEVRGAFLPYNLLNSLALQTGVGWTTTNATITAPGPPFVLTATAAAAFSATSPAGVAGMSVDSGRDYNFTVQTMLGAGSPGVGRIATVFVNWYTAAGALISTSTQAGTVADTTVKSVSGVATAPTAAVWAAIGVSFPDAAAGEFHQIRTPSVTPNLTTGGQNSDTWVAIGIQAGQAAQPVQSLASNGSYIWAALGTSGLHRSAAGSGSSTADVPAAPASGQISLVGYANGFLLAAGSAGVSATRQNSLWLVSDPLGTPALSLIKTHDNPNFVWTFISGGRNCVYVGGNSGGNGEIYKVLFDPNTGSLSTAASPATSWVDGETILALYFYAGGIILGTGKGLRLGQADGAGNIDYGPLIETDWPVRCLEPQGRYCWFGWTKYDASNSGLGRADLGYLTDTLTPAWASDLMTADTSTGDVVSAVTFAPYGYTANQRPPVRVFTVAGEGVYIEDPSSRVASGLLDTGTIRFSTSEPKTTRSMDVRHHALPTGGSVDVSIQADSNGNWTLLGSSSAEDTYGPDVPISGGDLSVEAMELRFTLHRPDGVEVGFDKSPEMTRWTAKVLPTPSTIDETFTLTLKMAAQIETNEGESYPLDVPAEVAYIKALEQARTVVQFQVGSDTFTGYVVKSQFKGHAWVSPARQYAEGTLTTVLQTVRG